MIKEDSELIKAEPTRQAVIRRAENAKLYSDLLQAFKERTFDSYKVSAEKPIISVSVVLHNWRDARNDPKFPKSSSARNQPSSFYSISKFWTCTTIIR